MKKLLTIIVLGLLWNNSGYAKSINYGYYKKNIDDKFIIEHLKSVQSGMDWIQTDSSLENSLLYCPPKKLIVNIDNIKNAIDLSIDEFKELNYTNKEIDELPVEFMLVQGLKILFPCK